MKIFFACPVRYISEDYFQNILSQVFALEDEGHRVYFPHHHTNQDDPTGLRICKDNRQAIKDADVVYVIWDGLSQGVMFDLGIAFALRKPIRTITGYMPPMTNGKSFQNMIFDWEENGSF